MIANIALIFDNYSKELPFKMMKLLLMLLGSLLACYLRSYLKKIQIKMTSKLRLYAKVLVSGYYVIKISDVIVGLIKDELQ